jgi:hypothetical protein
METDRILKAAAGVVDLFKGAGLDSRDMTAALHIAQVLVSSQDEQGIALRRRVDRRPADSQSPVRTGTGQQ